jgi:hypothetical protein
MGVAQGMHIRAEARDLHRAQHLERLGFGQIDHHQWIGAFERHDVRAVAHVANGANRLARLAQIAGLALNLQLKQRSRASTSFNRSMSWSS